MPAAGDAWGTSAFINKVIKEASEKHRWFVPMVLIDLLLDSRERGPYISLGDAPMEIRDPDAPGWKEAHVPGACLLLLIPCVCGLGLEMPPNLTRADAKKRASRPRIGRPPEC